MYFVVFFVLLFLFSNKNLHGWSTYPPRATYPPRNSRPYFSGLFLGGVRGFRGGAPVDDRHEISQVPESKKRVFKGFGEVRLFLVYFF